MCLHPGLPPEPECISESPQTAAPCSLVYPSDPEQRVLFLQMHRGMGSRAAHRTVSYTHLDEQDTKSIRNLILYEPDASEVFDAIVPEYLAGLIYGAVCESVASELAARRTAMEAATNNAEEMIEKLNLHYNRARQASITQEITEIVGGAEGV